MADTTGMDGFAIVPPQRGEGFVELSRSQQGRIFRKQILKYGELLYPGVKGGKVTIDEAFADTLKKNFDDHICDIVQVPKAGPNNEHSEDPDRNIGEVIGIVKATNGIYVDIDARSESDADKLGKTLLGASAMMHLNYEDTSTGKKVGPTLLHVAVTNRPYVTNLEDFEELAMLSAPGADTTYRAVVLTDATVEDSKMATLDNMLAELKADHGIDVPALQEKASNADKAVALSAKIQEELVGTGLLKLTNGEEATADVLIGAVAEAGSKIVELSGRVDSLVEDSAKKDATSEVKELVRTGHILPKDAEAMTELRLSNKALFEKIIPEKPLVKLTQAGEELGFESVDESHQKTVDDEIARLTAVASEKTSAYIRQ